MSYLPKAEDFDDFEGEAAKEETEEKLDDQPTKKSTNEEILATQDRIKEKLQTQTT